MLEGNDPQWSDATRRHLHAADDAIQCVSKASGIDGADAAVARAIGDAVVGCIAAVCSALSDIAAAIRDRPA